jgi:hypothetical protein
VFLNIVTALGLWAMVTIIAFSVIQKHKSERASLIGGAFFLVGSVAAVLILPKYLGIQDSCNTNACLQDKDIVNALVTFFIISWGAFGANLLSACISHK